MKDLVQYKSKCSNAIYNYTIDGDLSKLISTLQEVQEHAKQTIKGRNKSLWFKFFSGDTLATDIGDISRILSVESQQNKEFLLECFRLAISLDGELEVYYS